MNIDNHKSFPATYQGGAWGRLTPLTADQVPLVNTNGAMTVVDPAATNFTYRFYRAVTP